MKLPIYNVTLEGIDQEDIGIFVMSLVEFPAVETDFLQFEKTEQKFKIEDSKHIVSGVAMLADTPIYRRNEKMGEFYVQFPKDVLRVLVEKYFKQGNQNFVNFQHNEATLTEDAATLIESYFIDKERGVCPNEFSDIPDGSWIVSYHINDDTLWNEIQTSGELNGFSIECATNLDLAQFSKDENIEDIIEEYVKDFKQDHFASKTVDPILPELNDWIEPDVDLNSLNDGAIKYAIDNKCVAMITYSGTSAKGARQVAVASKGTTIAGNEALRIWEAFGASESNTMGWKIVLTSEITSFTVLPFMNWTSAQTGWYGETQTGADGTLVNVQYEATI